MNERTERLAFRCVLFAIIGVGILGSMNPLIELGLQLSLQVLPGSVMYETFLDSGEDIPVYFSVWLWNYTNSADYNTFKT